MLSGVYGLHTRSREREERDRLLKNQLIRMSRKQ